MGTPWVPRNPRKIDGPAQWTDLLDAKYRDKMIANALSYDELRALVDSATKK